MSRRNQQKENARLIGMGHETVLDADEPQFSTNMQHLLDAGVGMLQGDRKEPPAALRPIQRATRVVGTLVSLLAFLLPSRTPRTVKSFFPIVGLMLVLVGIGFLFGKGSTGADLVSMATGYGIVLLIALALVAIGCLLGWRLWLVGPLLLVAGGGIGYWVGAVWLRPKPKPEVPVRRPRTAFVIPMPQEITSPMAGRRCADPAA